MPKIDVALTRVSADRHWPLDRQSRGFDVHASIDVHRIERRSENLAITDFSVTYSYDPGIGQIRLKGKIRTEGKPEFVDKVERQEGKPYSQVLGYISKYSGVQAVKLSEQIRVPAPLPIPTLGSGKEEKEELGREYG